MGAETGAIAALAARARRRVVSHFMSANAVSSANAVAFDPGNRLERRYFERLCDAGVLRTAGGERYFLDAPAYDAFQQSRRRRGAMLLGGLGAAVAAAFGFGLIGH